MIGTLSLEPFFISSIDWYYFWTFISEFSIFPNIHMKGKLLNPIFFPQKVETRMYLSNQNIIMMSKAGFVEMFWLFVEAKKIDSYTNRSKLKQESCVFLTRWRILPQAIRFQRHMWYIWIFKRKQFKVSISQGMTDRRSFDRDRRSFFRDRDVIADLFLK